MNSKMIAIIAVVAMCGAALVGVGYAYTATYIDDAGGATVDVKYVNITGDAINELQNFNMIFNTEINNGVKTVTLDGASVVNGWVKSDGSAINTGDAFSGITYVKYILTASPIVFKSSDGSELVVGKFTLPTATEGTTYSDTGLYYTMAGTDNNSDSKYDQYSFSFEYVVKIIVADDGITVDSGSINIGTFTVSYDTTKSVE